MEGNLKSITDEQAHQRMQAEWEKRNGEPYGELDTALHDPQKWLTTHWGPACLREDEAKSLALRLNFANLITRKLKEELADVVSWLVALSYVIIPGRPKPADGGKRDELDPGPKKVLEELEREYSTKRDNEMVLACAYCGQPRCTDGCLILNNMSDELVQEVIKM